MKRTLLTLLSVLFCAITFAQSVPQGINYQAVARDASGDVLMNQTLTIQFSVISDITTSAVSWQETHTVSTNDYGLYTAIIGQGTATNVGSSAAFDSINWGASNHLLKVEVNYGGGLVDMGTTAFMSVPYSIYSANPGPQGLQGVPGVDGDDGQDGQDGIDGQNGDDGNDGNDGQDGADGQGGITNAGTGISVTGAGTSVSPYVVSTNDSLIQVVSSLDSSLTVLNSFLHFGCTDPTSFKYNATANIDNGTCDYAIGDLSQGGIIFYILQAGDIGYVAGQVHGLIAAPFDQSNAEWGCYGTAISGADGTAIGTGNQNTIDIEAGCTTAGTAADICANYTDGTYSDWFLPSKDELNEMYSNIGQGNVLGLGNVGGFASNAYWSSTEYGSFSAWLQGFSYGTQNNFDKYTNLNVRAVRAF
jgi:hypothetical protein